MIKRQKKMIVTLCLVASLFNSIIPLQASMTLLYKDALASDEVIIEENNEENNEEIVIAPGQEVIKIENKDFELFLSAIVDAATQSGNRAMLSEALLHCYDSLKDNQKMYYLKDLQEAMPEFMEIIELYSQNHKTDKAPRPGILAPAGENEIVGPGSCDLSAVTSLLHQIFTALNKCCAILQRDFRETWTILAEITSEINETFTILVDLKATISSDFNQTWTILDDIKSTITECCANITHEFQETWTIINAGFNGTFTAIEEINIDASGTFTVLTDIKNTITECCANITREFQETWTILGAGFNDTFSSLVEVNNTLTECCANVTREFQETWTILGALTSGCVSIQITQSLVDTAGGTYIIATPGNYVLAEDITSGGPVVINVDTSNVTIDLCNRRIAGNGDTTTIGILIETGATNINIVNGAISNMLTNGIQIEDNVDGLLISNIRVDMCGGSGILLSGATSGIRNAVIEHCLVETSATSAAAQGGLGILNASNIVVKSGQYNRNGTPGVTTLASGIFMSDVRNCIVSDLSMTDNTGIDAAGLILIGTNNIIDNCIANDNLATNTARGFEATTGLDNQFINCTANGNTGLSGYGFMLSTGEVGSVIRNCTAENNVGLTPFAVPDLIFGAGIFVDGANGALLNEILNNVVVKNNQSGIFDNAITFNATPAVTAGASQTLVAGNSAVENGLSGPAFLTTTPFKNYTVAYTTGAPIESVSFRYSTGAAPTISTAGATMMGNIDTRNV